MCSFCYPVSSWMWWNWKSCREDASLNEGIEQLLYRQRPNAPNLFILWKKESHDVHNGVNSKDVKGCTRL